MKADRAPASAQPQRAQGGRARADPENLRIAERSHPMQELLDRNRRGRPRQIPDAAKLDQRQPIRHSLGHAGGERGREAGVDKASAQPRLGDRAGREEGAGGEGQEF